MKKIVNVYLLGGMALASELPLPELPLAEQAANLCDEVTVRIGEIPLSLPGAREVHPGCLVTSSEYLLRIPEVASYRVSRGREILIQPEPGALEQDVRAYLLGSVLVALWHQRGLLPLHASAVSYPGGVAAFLANSGEGKSSVAAHLARRGFRVVSDDVCLVDAREESAAVVEPAAPWLKLWADSLEHLGSAAVGLEQVFSDEAKYRFPLGSAGSESVLERPRITKLVFLERQETPESESGAVQSGAVQISGLIQGEMEIRTVPPLQAMSMLMRLTHNAHLLEAMGKREQNFLQCGRVVSQAAVYRLIRPWGLKYMEASIDAIENLLKS